MKLVQGKLILINFSTIFFIFFSETLNQEMDNKKRTKRTYSGLIIGQKYEIIKYECENRITLFLLKTVLIPVNMKTEGTSELKLL